MPKGSKGKNTHLIMTNEYEAWFQASIVKSIQENEWLHTQEVVQYMKIIIA